MDTNTSKYLESLNNDKLTLVDNLNEMVWKQQTMKHLQV